MRLVRDETGRVVGREHTPPVSGPAGIGPPVDCGLLSFTSAGWPVFRDRTDTTAGGWPVTDPARIAELRAERGEPVDDPEHADRLDETGTRPVVDAAARTGPAVVANADSVALMIAAAALTRAKRDHPELFDRRRRRLPGIEPETRS